MKYCPSCGAQNKEEAAFCCSCGNRFQQTESYTPVRTEVKKSGSGNIGLPAIAFAAMGLIAVLSYLFTLFKISASGGLFGFSAGMDEAYSGYQLLFEGGLGFGSVMLWFAFIIALAVFVVTVITFINMFRGSSILNLTDPEKVFKLTAIGAVVYSIIYMIIGLSQTGSSDVDILIGSASASVSTAAFWPLIINAVLIAAFIVMKRLNGYRN